MTSSNEGLVNFSLTNNCLKLLETHNEKHGNFFSLTVIHIGGSVATLITTLSDTVLQLAASVVKAVSGLFLSPINFVVAPFTNWRVSNHWGWSMAANHFGQSGKYLLGVITVPLVTLFSTPKDARNMLCKELVVRDELLVVREGVIELQQKLDERTHQIYILKNEPKTTTKSSGKVKALKQSLEQANLTIESLTAANAKLQTQKPPRTLPRKNLPPQLDCQSQEVIESLKMQLSMQFDDIDKKDRLINEKDLVIAALKAQLSNASTTTIAPTIPKSPLPPSGLPPTFPPPPALNLPPPPVFKPSQVSSGTIGQVNFADAFKNLRPASEIKKSVKLEESGLFGTLARTFSSMRPAIEAYQDDEDDDSWDDDDDAVFVQVVEQAPPQIKAIIDQSFNQLMENGEGQEVLMASINLALASSQLLNPAAKENYKKKAAIHFGKDEVKSELAQSFFSLSSLGRSLNLGQPNGSAMSFDFDGDEDDIF